MHVTHTCTGGFLKQMGGTPRLGHWRAISFTIVGVEPESPNPGLLGDWGGVEVWLAMIGPGTLA